MKLICVAHVQLAFPAIPELLLADARFVERELSRKYRGSAHGESSITDIVNLQPSTRLTGSFK